MFIRATILLCAIAVLAPTWAEDTSRDVPFPQDGLLPTTLATLQHQRDDIDNIALVVQLGLNQDNPTWNIRQIQMQVLINKLQTMPDTPMPEDDIWPKVPDKNPQYKGISLLASTIEHRRFMPINVFKGRVTTADGALLAPDYGRRLEYWLFGTARVKREQMLGVSVLPVISFEQCRILGQRIVETNPRQCLLPDNNILLDTGEMPTVKSARMKDFDECLQSGEALIYTFPRRCITKGGRVFTEPPRVFENLPADAPLATSATFDVSKSMGGLKNTTSPTIPSQPGMPQISVTALGNIAPAAGDETPRPRKKLQPGFYPDIEWADYGQHP